MHDLSYYKLYNTSYVEPYDMTYNISYDIHIVYYMISLTNAPYRGLATCLFLYHNMEEEQRGGGGIP